jgi:hypothetical protein
MGRTYDTIDDRIQTWLDKQPMFFVATAPLDASGHVNVSPKGLDGSFVVLDSTSVAYLDLMGSGVETLAHVKENQRITLMFCAFEGPARIVRLYGDGEAIEADHPDFDDLVKRFPENRSVRSVIRVAVTRIADSCGYGVPNMAYQGQRDQLERWVANRTDEQLADYLVTANAESLDGLPAFGDNGNVRA